MDTYMHSKLYTPVPGDLIVSRRHLFNILDSVYDKKTVFISAPAGYGKTTTVTAWLKARGLECAWVSLDEDDDNPVRFMRYLCASVGRYLTDSIDSTGADPHVLLDELLYALQDSRHDFILVLDDCHHINNPEIIRMLLRFMQYKPPWVHLVITNRGRLPGRFKPALLKQYIVVIKDEQLLFNKKEIRSFFQLRQMVLDNDQINDLMHKTEGWPCGLVAMSMAIPQSDNIGIPFLTSNEYIYSFLRNEVWEQWDEDTRAFFLQTSILNEFSVSLAQIVTQMDNCHEILERIYTNRGFLITLDANEEWYRYHQVFRGFLRALLEKDGRYDIAEIKRRTAAYYCETGDVVRAMSYYKSAEDYQGMMRLIHDHCAPFLCAVDAEKVIQTIDALESYGSFDDLRILVCYGWAMEFNRQFEKAETVIQSLIRKLTAQRCQMEREEAERIHIEICALSLPISLQVGSTRKMLYNFREVLKKQDTDTIVFSPASLPAIMGNKFTLLDTVYGFFGRINHYMRFTKKTFDMIYKALRKQYKNVGSLPVARAEILYQLDRIDEAMPYLSQGMEESDENGLLRIYIPAMLCLADIHKAKGDIAGAYHTIGKCGEMLANKKDYLGLEIVHAYKASLDMAMNDMDAVRQWEEQTQISPYDTVSYHALYQYLTLAHVLVQTNRRTQARLLLEKIELYINDMPAIVYRIRVTYLLARLALKDGDRPMAIENLSQAFRLGYQHGYTRIFADRGEDMKTLLDLAFEEKIYRMKKGPALAYLNQLAEATDVYIERTKDARSQESRTHQEEMSVMTPREMDILLCISKNMTNQEIADQIFVSLQTVKNYTSRIYRKLGVSSRMQAVGAAKDRGLIP